MIDWKSIFIWIDVYIFLNELANKHNTLRSLLPCMLMYGIPFHAQHMNMNAF